MIRIRIALVLLLVVAFTADARIGGGDSYSGSDSSSSSSSSDSDSYSSSDHSDYGGSSSSGGGSSSGMSGGALMFVFFVFFALAAAQNFKHEPPPMLHTLATSEAQPARPDMSQLRQHDANFSEIVFTDFCYSLFARLHEARGRGDLDRYAPYVSAAVRNGMRRDSPVGLSNVDAIVIGSFTIVDFRGIYLPRVEVKVELEANYTETTPEGTRRWYVRDRWTLTRARDILSPAPTDARAEHCPKCGAALQTRSDGACSYCGTLITDGSFHWFLQSVECVSNEERSPHLGGPAGPEAGLSTPTVYQPWVRRKLEEFARQHPDFTWTSFEERVRLVANELQTAWTARDWTRARPFETDALFQTHRYWIDEYLRQGLRNVVDHFSISGVDAVRVTSDAFYDAITVRMYASGADYTIDEQGELAGGSKDVIRQWSEYWTFIRGRSGAAADARICPNCGATRAEGQTAICDYCGGKITTGEFPWILSRIEQDESYRG